MSDGIDWNEVMNARASEAELPADFYDPPTAERILTDLIAVLRSEHAPVSRDCNDPNHVCCHPVCEWCSIMSPCPTLIQVDRAEARMREVIGDE